MTDLDATVSLRPAVPEDEPFLSEVYASTRRAELAEAGIPAEFAEPFLRQQYETQSRAYPLQFPGIQHLVVLVSGTPAGRMWVWRTAGELLLADIALLPEFRGRGIGTSLIRGLQEEAASRGAAVRLHVTEGERVAALYRRLGFATVHREAHVEEMVWRTGAGA